MGDAREIGATKTAGVRRATRLGEVGARCARGRPPCAASRAVTKASMTRTFPRGKRRPLDSGRCELILYSLIPARGGLLPPMGAKGTALAGSVPSRSESVGFLAPNVGLERVLRLKNVLTSEVTR